MTQGGRNVRRGLFWVLFAATLVLYGVIVLWSLPQISKAASGLPPFDLRPLGYSLDEATAFLAALSGEARDFYLGPQHWLDLFYPALLGATLIWSILWAFREFPLVLRGVLIMPAVAGAVFDWVENAQVAVLLRAEIVAEAAVSAASFATVAKSMATTLAMVILLAGLARRGWRSWKGMA